MKYLLLVLIQVACAETAFTQAPAWAWAKAAGANDKASSNQIAVDAGGNCYIAGKFNGLFLFGISSLTSVGGADIYLAKYDASGNFIWARQAGGTGSEEASNVALDQNGNAYITGTFTTTITFDGTTLTSYGGKDLFLAKYDASGNLVWAQNAGGSGDDLVAGLASNKNGHILVAGYYTDACYFGNIAPGGQTLTSAGGSDIFLAQYDTNGNITWARSAGGTEFESATEVATDDSGNIYVAGFYQNKPAYFGTLKVDPISINGVSGNIVLAKYNDNGDVLWARGLGAVGVLAGPYSSPGWLGQVYLAVAPNGNAHLLGNIDRAHLRFHNGHTISNFNSTAIYLAQYSSMGDLTWAHMTNGNSAQAYEVFCSNNNDLYISGHLSAPINFGSQTLAQASDSDLAIIKFDNLGNAGWKLPVNGAYIPSFACSPVGADIYVTGNASKLVTTFGSHTVANSGGALPFLAKLSYSTGISNIGATVDDVSVFPNPSDGTITISLPGINSYEHLSMTDQAGRLLYYHPIPKNEKQIQLNGNQFPSGVYWLTASGSKGSVTKKIMLQ